MRLNDFESSRLVRDSQQLLDTFQTECIICCGPLSGARGSLKSLQDQLFLPDFEELLPW